MFQSMVVTRGPPSITNPPLNFTRLRWMISIPTGYTRVSKITVRLQFPASHPIPHLAELPVFGYPSGVVKQDQQFRNQEIITLYIQIVKDGLAYMIKEQGRNGSIMLGQQTFIATIQRI